MILLKRIFISNKNRSKKESIPLENIDEIIWIEDYIPFNINYQSEVYEMNPQKVYPNTLLAEYLNYKIQMIEED